MKVKDPIFHSHFFNKDISVTNEENIQKFSGVVLEVSHEGSVSQVYLRPSCHFMLCRIFFY